MTDLDIVKAFTDRGYIVEPAALELIRSSREPGSIVGMVLSSLDNSALLVSREVVERVCSARTVQAAPPRIRICQDSKSTCMGGYDEFVKYFRDRYSRLGDMLRSRISARPIESLVRKKGMLHGSDKSEIAIIGMVSEQRVTSNGHRMIDVEDQTGSMSVLISKDSPVFSTPLLLDEVVGITGVLNASGDLFVAKSIVYPDIPIGRLQKKSEEPALAALISDIHVGSNTFLEDSWLSFIDWCSGGEGEDDDGAMADRLKYIVVAGDLVDGIGIYPGQEHELNILDIYEQYEKVAEYFQQIPSHISVVIAPGNHDAVRQAEPQPALPKEIRDMFKKGNVTFVGNPAAVEVEGVRLLIYHGRSLDDLVSSLPGISYAKPDVGMAELLKRRHLSPIYGGRVMIAPESSDHFIIDPVPDIIHSGHVHTVGVSRYRGVLLANSGAWQGQTEFQRRMNIQPDPAKIPLVDLQKGEVSILKFGS